MNRSSYQQTSFEGKLFVPFFWLRRQFSLSLSQLAVSKILLILLATCISMCMHDSILCLCTTIQQINYKGYVSRDLFTLVFGFAHADKSHNTF